MYLLIRDGLGLLGFLSNFSYLWLSVIYHINFVPLFLVLKMSVLRNVICINKQLVMEGVFLWQCHSFL